MPPSDAAWQQKLAALRAHVAAHGRLPPRDDPSGLGNWVSNQRQGKKAMDAGKVGTATNGMTPERAAALERVPGWAWAADFEAAWQEKLAATRAYVDAHGRLPPWSHPSGLGVWLATLRAAKRAMSAGRRPNANLSPDRVAALEAVPGWTWDDPRRKRTSAPASGEA